MGANILVTGAAGYIGGAIVTNFLSSTDPLLLQSTITAAVRSPDQATAVRALGIKAIQLNLADPSAVLDFILQDEIDLVIQTVSSIDPAIPLPLVTALGKRRAQTGAETFYVQTSGLSAFYASTGWPEGEFSDRDAGIFEKARALRDSFPVRQTDVSVIEAAKAVGVKSFVVVPSQTFGRGAGPWNQLSVTTPRYIKKSIENRRTGTFSTDSTIPYIHISDLAAFYARLVGKILRRDADLDSGERGFYFAISFHLHTWDFFSRITQALKARSLIDNEEPVPWKDYDEAAKDLGVPAAFVEILWNSSGLVKASNEEQLQFTPQWTKERSEDNVDGEVRDVLELGRAKSSLIASLEALGKEHQ